MKTPSNFSFPFGQPIHCVEQVDKSPKKVFVLGVYASAVHARWCDNRGKELVKALAVASEPEIFWCGEDSEARSFISSIKVPSVAGYLEPAAKSFNGPSGRALHELFLEPLCLARDQVWLCDLIPHSCMNQGQSNALWREYYSVIDKYELPPVHWSSPPKSITNERVDEVADELYESQAELLITLGDAPLKWFASSKLQSKSLLRSYGKEPATYGKLHDVEFGERKFTLLPLVHPRQAARMPGHRRCWADLHETWVQQTARNLFS